MTNAPRPLIAIPGRFSASASALRYAAVVNARALTAAVLNAGGEPLTVHPVAPDGRTSVDEVAQRLAFCDGVLLPGGGDVDPGLYGEAIASDEVYDVDVEQDAFDIAVARWAWDSGVPVLAVCRGMQITNVALGGTLQQHMGSPHRHTVAQVEVSPGSLLADVMGTNATVSCFHHQCLGDVADGLRATARHNDGTIEAVERAATASGHGWFLGVQWHPEDTAATDSQQHGLFSVLVEAARERRAARKPELGG